MNWIVKRELDKLKNCEIIQEGNTFTIKRIENCFEEGCKYTVEVSDYMMNKETVPIIIDNLNKGSIPPKNLLVFKVEKSWGEMILVDCINCSWKGWLPVAMIKRFNK